MAGTDASGDGAAPEKAAPASAAAAVKDLASPGVARVEALAATMTTADRVCVFLGVFLLAACYTLDGILRFAYQTAAAASLGQHSLQATINVVRAVVAAAAQPVSAKVADVFGRVELLCVAVVLYLVGSVVEATAADIQAFAAGGLVYQVGYTMMMLLVEVIVADFTSTRARLFFSYMPALPFLVNTWVSGNISAAVLRATTWRWGVAMWCIVLPVCAAPLLASLAVVSRRARRRGLNGHRSSLELFWLLDVVGLLLMVSLFALVLVPLTLAGGFRSLWATAPVVAPLVVGVLCLPAFVAWELRAPHPLFPFALMRDRAVWAPLGIAVFLTFAFSMQSSFLFTVLQVAFDFSVGQATRITSLYSFTSVVTGALLGLVVFKVRRLKTFAVVGTTLYMAAFGLLIHYRGSPSASSRDGVIGAEVLLGIAGGLFPYTTMASLQVGLRHEHLAVVTGVYLAMYNIGSALGSAVSGALWSQLLLAKLDEALAGLNSTLAAAAYADPFKNVVAVYPVGTPERTAVIGAYQSVQRLLCVTGVCLCVPLVVLAALLRDPKLSREQTLAGQGAPEPGDAARPRAQA